MPIRPRKDGNGCSECRAKPENVGKRKCCHTMEGASFQIRKEGSTKFIDISGYDEKDTNIDVSVKATSAKIRKIMDSLSEGLSTKEKKSYEEFCRNA